MRRTPKWVQPLIRISNILRIFCCFDEGNLVVLFNGFQKKTQKTPKKEIEKAARIKAEYFDYKMKGSKK
jgi:phage-related protein